jgi:hypothetical protein
MLAWFAKLAFPPMLLTLVPTLVLTLTLLMNTAAHQPSHHHCCHHQHYCQTLSSVWLCC